MPEVSDDFRIWTVRIKPGIYFADDPAFKGKRRELVAQDYVYAFKRVVDPRRTSARSSATCWSARSSAWPRCARAAVKSKKPFDYDAPIEGLRALDRYTLRFTLDEPRPRFLDTLADVRPARRRGARGGRVLRRHDRRASGGHRAVPAEEWRRSSRIVLERNPDYREVLYDAEPAADDAEGQAILARVQGPAPADGRRGRQSRSSRSSSRSWLSFLNKQVDALATSTGHLPSQFANEAAPSGKLAPQPGQAGVSMYAQPGADIALHLLQHGRSGGRRLHAGARWRCAARSAWPYDVEREIRLIRRGRRCPRSRR